MIFNIYAQTVSRIPCRHFTVASKNKHFILADILVLVSEFVVVVILSEWWSGPTTANRCGHIPALPLEKSEMSIKRWINLTSIVKQRRRLEPKDTYS